MNCFAGSNTNHYNDSINIHINTTPGGPSLTSGASSATLANTTPSLTPGTSSGTLTNTTTSSTPTPTPTLHSSLPSVTPTHTRTIHQTPAFLTPNPTKSAPSLTNTANSQKVLNDDDIHLYHNITTTTDLNFRDWSPSNANYQEVLEGQSTYFHDHYRQFWNWSVSLEVNVLAFKHFESTHKKQILQNYKLNITNEHQNVYLERNGGVSVSTDCIMKNEYKRLMIEQPHLLQQSFQIAQGYYPDNHNHNAPISHQPQSPDAAPCPRVVLTMKGLPGGGPTKKKKKSKTKAKTKSKAKEKDPKAEQSKSSGKKPKKKKAKKTKIPRSDDEEEEDEDSDLSESSEEDEETQSESDKDDDEESGIYVQLYYIFTYTKYIFNNKYTI